MRFERLSATRQALVATRSRNAKRDLIAEVLRDTTAEDVKIVVSYLSGSLRQRRTGLGWTSLQATPEPATEPTLTVLAVDATLSSIAALSGVGSTNLRSAAAQALFARATSAEQELLLGLITGELRQGALETQVQDGLATAFDVPVSVVRRAAMLLSSTAAAALILLVDGRAGLDAVRLTVGVAVQPMLAASAPDAVAAADKSGLPAAVDDKLDGIRVQVHRDAGQVRIFTRSLDDITERLPEVVAIVLALPHPSMVLDGEVLMFRDDGTPEAFQVVASRAMSSVGIAELVQASPVKVFFFDLLHLDGQDLLDAPLRERIATMSEVLPAEIAVRRRICDTAEEVAAAFTDAVTGGYEGVVVKSLDAPYAAGRRDSAWVKVKPRHTLDLIVIAAEWGHGRRQGWLSNLHLAARDSDSEELIMLGKTFKGLTDELLSWQTARLLELETRRSAGTVFVEPSVVVEVACDGVQTSTRYPGGVALRFARVLRYRPDKNASEADTIESVRELRRADD